MPKIQDGSNYSWQQCQDHFQKAATGSLKDRTVHFFSGLIGLVPALFQKINSIFQELFSSKVNAQPSSARPLDGRVSSNPPTSFTLPQLRLGSKFVQIANILYAKRDELFNRCQSNDQLKEFTILIAGECRRNNISFRELCANREARAILEKSGRLQAAIQYYPTVVREMQLIEKSEILYNKRNEFIQAALKKIPADTPKNLIPKRVAIAATFMIRIWCQKQNFSFSEILSNKICLGILNQDPNFMLVHRCYMMMKEAEMKQPSPAEKLAREHAQGAGLVTQLGLNAVADQSERLNAELKKVQLQEHPDAQARNKAAGRPAPDIEKFKKADELRKMIAGHEYEEYRAELARLRNK